MKKGVIFTVILVLAVTASTVFAKTFKNITMERKLKEGYSETDVYSMLAIISNCEEKSMPVIESKYRELGSWEAVAEYYNINPIDYEISYNFQSELEEKLAIPDETYAEMINSGMTEAECREFSMKANNAQIDVVTAWEAQKNGKTINDLIKERTALKTSKAQAATDYTFGEITEEEYIKKMKSLSPDMPMSEIIEFAAKDRREWREARIVGSGITEEEIAFAEKCGITDIFEICRMKDAEKFSGKSFVEMASEVKKGTSVDTVIKQTMQAVSDSITKEEVLAE